MIGSLGRSMNLPSGNRVLQIVLMSCAISALMACGMMQPAKPVVKENVTLRLNFKTAGQDMPWFLGVDKGFYADEGLNVEVLEGTSETQTLHLVASKSDTFGWLDLATMASGVAQGIPVRSVSAINQKSPNAIIARSDSQITKPADLTGKKVSMVAGTSMHTLWPAFLRANNLDSNKISLVTLDSGARNQAILNKQVDAIGAFGHSSGVALKSQGLDVNILFYSDHGLPAYGQGIVAHTDTLKEKPDMVRRFVKASHRAWEYAKDHPDEALQSALKVAPTLRPSAKDELVEVVKR